MSLSSMTGYARAGGAFEGVNWQWELRSVNGKALDLRCRLSPGFEHLESSIRERAGKALRRGNIQVSLTSDNGAARETIMVNHRALAQVIALAEDLRKRLGGEPPRVEGLLALRGILEPAIVAEDEAKTKERDAAMLTSFDTALTALVQARSTEGAKLGDVIDRQLKRIEELVTSARDNPARSSDAIRARLKEQVQRLLAANTSFDADRLHQEAILITTRVDIQEEIDRLFSHIEAARALLESPGPAGRSFDFLAQEFNREANTLCSKASDRSLTQTGLDLKAVIDQMREQVQNIE